MLTVIPIGSVFLKLIMAKKVNDLLSSYTEEESTLLQNMQLIIKPSKAF